MTSTTHGAGFGTARHLVGRFFASLWPGGPHAGDEAWATSWLLDRERLLWLRMSGPDRRHAVAVARRVSPGHGDGPGDGPGLRAVMAAALLHDVGKVDAGLGTWGRAGATAAAVVVGRDRLARRPGRIGLYLRHDEIGAARLEAAASDPITIAWTREHHLAPERWTLPRSIASALKAADDD